MKKFILLSIIIGLLFAGTLTLGTGFSVPNYWKLSGSNLSPIIDTMEIGSSGTRILKGWFDDINTTTATIGAILSGDLDMNGNKIILDADGDTSIQADTDDQIDFELGGADIFVLGYQAVSNLINSVDTSTVLKIQNTDTAIGTAGYLLELIHDSDNDADADFLICQDDGAGTPDTVFSIAHDGSIVVGGSLTSTFTDSVSIGSETASDVDMGAGANADVFITDDLEVGGVITDGGLQLNHQTLTASTLTLDKDDGVVECDTTSNANAITLPECSTVLGQIYTIYFETDNAADVTVTVAGGDTFAGVGDIGDTLATMADVGDFITIQAVSDTRWAILANNGATLSSP